jgi:two-component system, OmpR family, sensor histidine kinase MprB
VRVRPRDWSVHTRLGLVSTLAATVGLGVAGLTAYAVTSEVLYGQVDDSLRESPAALAEPLDVVLGDRDDPGLRTEGGVIGVEAACRLVESSQAPSPGLFVVALVLPDGRQCADPDGPQIVLRPTDLDTSASGQRLRDGELTDGHRARVSVSVTAGGAVVLAARDTEPIDNVLDVLAVVLVGLTALGAAIALVLSRFATRLALRPVTRFARVAERIAATGRLLDVAADAPPTARRPDRRADELARLTTAFETMTAVLADAEARQRRLVADAGHELRTPLTSLRANVSLLARSRALGRPLPPDDEDRLLDDLVNQMTELSALVDDLADLAFIDQTPPPFQELRLDECVEDAVDRARSRTSDHDLVVALEPWVVSGHGAALERAVVNLLDNALKFSPAGTAVEVTLAGGVLTVADRGPGLSTEERRQAFERFWRSRTARRLPGSGLGLAIVHDVAVQHRGSVELTARPGGGTVATLRLPGRPG